MNMRKIYLMLAITLIIVALLIAGGSTMLGSGGLERMVKISGIYPICKPKGYDVVCFLDADSKDGGMSCIPLSQAGGKCL